MLDERYLWLSAFIEHPKFNLDTRTATNSYLTKVYNNLQKVFLIVNSFYHPTAKAVGFRFSVNIGYLQCTSDLADFDRRESDLDGSVVAPDGNLGIRTRADVCKTAVVDGLVYGRVEYG